MAQKVKLATEMDYSEFKRWALETIVDHFLSEGLKGISTGLDMVLNQVAQNTIFGGGKKK